MKNFLKKNRIGTGIVVVILLGLGVYWYVSSSVAPTFGQSTVSKGNIVESVDEAGTVLAENNANIAFQEAGQIAHVYVSEGSNVAAGTVLANLDTSQLQAARDQANGALAAAQAKLDSLKAGTRPEQIQINQNAVNSATQSLAIAIQNAYSASDDAVRNQMDNLFSNPQTNNPVFLVSGTNSQQQNQIQSQRVVMGTILTQSFNALNSSSTSLVNLSNITNATLPQIKAYVDTIALVVNSAPPSANIPASTLAQYKTDVATSRTEIEASISAVNSAESALTTAQAQLTLAQAGATTQDIAAQQAAVLQAQAAASSAQIAIDHASLIAPFSGTVQNLTAQVGQVVTSGAPLLALVNNGGLKIVTNVSQSDVAKIKTGDTANVSLDAFGSGTNFPATVTTVDSAETQVNGSSAYQITLHFVTPDSRVKDGMTANVHITAAEHDNVTEVPSNLVINDNNNYFVLVQNGSAIEKRAVQIGLVGDNGMTEITSGLNVGDHINNF